MAFVATRAAVTDVASLAFGTGQNYQGFAYTKLLVQNIGAFTVFVGGLGVTAATGFPIAAGQAFSVAPVGTKDDLYAICATAQTSTLALLATDPPAS